ncbi:uncharacterized CRM domain-containing protein At3g25440, chloroplastic [Morus notabilis]|uniref:uncharacterized CRM domain-containing protein At3g25440, chloroplastic n=1 Tax=Morus notabilis TaxID=981085 RepID=UPI000CED3B27|nr:uncharacterized CRM domain-containing protein At3g25440, chloroplastic [Morus notabilis]
MFASRNLHRHSFKSLSSLFHSASSKTISVSRDFSAKIISSNVVQPSKPREDGLLFSSSSSSSSAMVNPFDVRHRSMSTARGGSMRSKVEKRMKKESGKTLREIRRAKKIQKKLMTESERLIYNLKRAKKKVALLLQKLKKYELPELPQPRHDPELLTQEQLQAYKKIGFKNKNYVPVGVRGVFGGVVQNMHLHWKFHETVQVCCDNFPKEKIKEMATMIARLSGGIVINIHNVKTIIMFRGRNYRQPKNLIPINTLTKRKALFKARFEQALESQKLNIKKFEQQLRRSGINPEDPVATASIQRVASSFFNAIDKKEGTPYVFREDKLSATEPNNIFEPTEPSDEKEQEELDKFIAEIEDAAEREWAAEEAAEKEDFGRIRYLNREEFGGRFRRSETFRDDGSDGEINRSRSWKDTRGEQRTYESDDDDEVDASEADDEWQSHNARDAGNFDSGSDDSDENEKFKAPSRNRGRQENFGRARYNDGYKRNSSMNFRRSIVEEESETENVLGNLENAMWQSDSEEKHNPSASRPMNYEYRSDSDEEDSYDLKGGKGGKITHEYRSDTDDSEGESQASRFGKYNYRSSGDEEEKYQVKRAARNESDIRRTRTTKQMDEDWDSD